ncbi:MAG: radical SAM protein [Candidatus Omnitrophica bacterium]|jgi:MoaA/NifB/PqqE/SkfB family radical SAM enzyme|nr:radical SAM protein [Candidatus Omnitrophota bacterium]MDD5660759.1 radical SAM protein [Candidatus Omnitrophota bacterium]
MPNIGPDDYLLKDIKNGFRASMGPQIVQFDITNKCNNNCLCCWNRSPLLGELSMERKKENNEELKFEVIRKTLEELRQMGTKTIFLAGGGEPFAHPDILKVLRCIKENNMRTFINTNFTLINKEIANQITKLKIDHIHVSLLAGTAKTYAGIHPNKTEETFHQIVNLLKYISSLKEQSGQHLYNPLPHINLYYVIFSKNYKEIDKMIDVAIETKADSVEFTPVDVIPGYTDSLLLGKKESEHALNMLDKQSLRIEQYNIHEPVKISITQKESFIKRISSQEALLGKYESDKVINQPCYVGWVFARIKADGSVNPCLKAHRISIGNIHEKSFKEIWNSTEEQLFREKAFTHNPNDPYFNLIGNDANINFGCIKSCDNIQINQEMHAKYAGLLQKDDNSA